MNDDLRTALGQIAGGAARTAGRSPRPGLDPTTLVPEARRRRRRFRSQAVGAGLATTLALGAGGLAVADAVRDPSPPVDDPFEGTAPAFTRELPGCGDALELDEDADDGWLVDVAVPTLQPDTTATVDVRLGLDAEGDEVAQGASHRDAVVLLLRGGVVVGTAHSESTAERDVEATADAQDDLGFTGTLATCEGADLEPGTYEARVALELRPAWYRFADGSEAVTDAAYGWQVAGPVDVEVTVEWRDVAADRLPDEVPLAAGRVIRAQEHADGDRWRAEIEIDPAAAVGDTAVGDSAFGYAEALLLDAGFTPEADADVTDGSSRRAFTGGGYRVELQVDLSNGAYASYVISRTDDAEPLEPRTVLPEGDASLPFGECGSLVTSDPALPPAPPLEVWWEGLPTTARPGAALQVRADVVGSGSISRVLPATGPRVLAVREGVVVGAGGLFADEGGPVAVGGPVLETGVLGLFDLVVCEPEAGGRATGGHPLPAGDYELWAIAPEVTWVQAEVWQSDDMVRAVLDHPDARRASVLSEPVTIRLEGEPVEGSGASTEETSDVDFPEPTGSELPACGAPAPEVSTGMLRVEHPAGPLTAGPDGQLGTEATLRYVGPGRATLFPGNHVEYTVVQDGVVVGEIQDPGSDGQTLRIRHGMGLTVPAADVVLTCAEPDRWSDALPPGRYQLHPSVHAAVDGVVRTDGTHVDNPAADPGSQVYGEPVELVVE